MFYIYVLFSQKDRKLYTGFSTNLRSRFKEHLACKVKITQHRLPLELVYYEAFKFEDDARRQELFYKSGHGIRVLKKRLSFLNTKVI